MGPGTSRIENNGTGSQVQVNQRGRGARSDEKGSASACLGIPVRGSAVNDYRTLLQSVVIKKCNSATATGSSGIGKETDPRLVDRFPKHARLWPKDFPCLRYSGQPAGSSLPHQLHPRNRLLIRVDQNGTAVHRNVDPAFYDQFPCGDDFQCPTAGGGFPRFPTPPPEPPMRNERSAEP